MADKQIHELPQGTYSNTARIPQQRQVSAGVWADEYITPGDLPQNSGNGGGGLTPVLKAEGSADFTASANNLYIVSGTSLLKITCPAGANVGDRFAVTSVVNEQNFSVRSPVDANVLQGNSQLLSTQTDRGIVNLPNVDGYSYVEFVKVATNLWYATIQVNVDVQFDPGGAA